MGMVTADLAGFLLARITDDEAAARAIVDPLPLDSPRLHTLAQGADPEHVVAVVIPPARLLAECEAKRRIVERCRFIDEELQADQEAGWVGSELDDILKALALPHADHPDYRDEWRP